MTNSSNLFSISQSNSKCLIVKTEAFFYWKKFKFFQNLFINSNVEILLIIYAFNIVKQTNLNLNEIFVMHTITLSEFLLIINMAIQNPN